MNGPVTEVSLTSHAQRWRGWREEVLLEDGDTAVGFGAGRALGFAEGSGGLLNGASGLHGCLAGQEGGCGGK